MSDALEELMKFLQIGARLDLKTIALETILGLTGSEDGLNNIIGKPKLLTALLYLLRDNNESIAKDAAMCFVNISANERGAKKLIDLDPAKYALPLQTHPNYFVIEILQHILNKRSDLADQCCMILSNITRPPHLLEKVIDFMEESDDTFDNIINVFSKVQFNERGAGLHYLGPTLSNLTRSPRVRLFIFNKSKNVLKILIAFTEYKDSLIRRGGVIGTLKNCCFDDTHHEWLLSEEVDILPKLLLPLAGNEEFDDEDMEKLPIELQYLPEDKVREEDPVLRTMLLEALTQLCTKRPNREYIRDKNTYLILRELHKWESEKEPLLACENLVDILIRTEDEIDADNLKKVEIPKNLEGKFEKLSTD